MGTKISNLLQLKKFYAAENNRSKYKASGVVSPY